MRRGSGLCRREDGGVLVLVSIVVPLLVMLAAGGIATYGLSASARELQRAADQSALAGAIALPPVDPNVLIANAPFPIPSTDPAYDLLPPEVAPYIPRMGDLIPDPRRVACEVGEAGLASRSAAVVGAIGDDTVLEPPSAADGSPQPTVCDVPVYPVIEPNPHATTPIDCTNRLVQRVAQDVGSIDPTVDVVLDPVLTPVQGQVNQFVRMPLNHVLPAAFTPRMRVDVYAGVEPPMLSLITSSSGGTLHSTATAYRRIKNAVVVPILPAQRVLIDTGAVNPLTGKPFAPIDFMTDPVNLNTALATQQATLIDAIDDADSRLDTLMAQYVLPCQHLLHNLRQDLRDIYAPPTGPAPTATDIVDAAIGAAEQVAARTGLPQPDPSNPSSLAGEAFVLVGVTTDEFMRPVSALQIPILDVALVSMRKVADGDYRAAVIAAANAYGAFRASLVE